MIEFCLCLIPYNRLRLEILRNLQFGFIDKKKKKKKKNGVSV